MDLVYHELRRIAISQQRGAPAAMTLNATGVVHEAFLKLMHYDNADWNDRGHFFAVATRAMRQVVVDYCRQRLAKKRGGDAVHHELNEELIAANQQAENILNIDRAMETLEAENPKLARVVECRFFAGLSEAETSEAMDASLRSVQRYWHQARQRLQELLEGSN